MASTGGDLILAGVTKTYVPAHEVLRGVSMTARPGETVSVVGPSGCGKSTLLNIIGSLDQPTSGTVALGDIDIAGLSGDELAAFRSNEVGFIFQDHHLLPQLTALENVLLPSLATSSRDATPRARELLGRVGLSDQAESLPAQMSGGERQRVAVARAMINEPKLLLCDEPTGNLDHEAGENVVSLFLEMAGEGGVTVVMVTHNLDFAREFSRCVELRGGRLTGTEPAAR
mgnify:CR=1 FL=1